MTPRRLLGEARGAELVEFALMSFAFFIVVFGTIEFGRMIWQDNLVASAAKDGARWASVRGATATTPATQDSVRTYVRERAPGLTVDVTTFWDPGNMPAGGTVTVRVEGSFQPILPWIPQGLITLRSTSQMLIAR